MTRGFIDERAGERMHRTGPSSSEEEEEESESEMRPISLAWQAMCIFRKENADMTFTG